ncbi:hypothetical protein BASA81_016023 [Batrachochytrium salamandrivorans]|nr:hypothetical protein BASA81_016023 [Batrachochytrium salamandrivorans]
MVKMNNHDRQKLEFNWKGPYHVVDVGHPGTYWIITPQGLRLPNAINQADLAPWLAPVIGNIDFFYDGTNRNSSLDSSNINRSIPNTPFINTSITSTPTTIPITPHCRDPTPVLQVCTRTYIPSLGQVQIGLQLCAGKPRVKCKILRSPALSTGQAIGASSSHWPAVVAYGTILGHSRQVSYTPQQQTPISWAVPACVYSVMLTWTASPWPTWW